MKLTRTVSGLFSLPKFLRVDTIIFCEGGSDVIDLSDIKFPTQVKRSQNTKDEYFWRMLFQHYNHDSVHVKSAGSKSALETIFKKIDEHNIPNILICMDHDYSNISENKLKSPVVKYTYGYSWENDIFSIDVIENYLRKHTSPQECSEIDLKRLREEYDEFCKKAYPWVKIDYALVSRGKAALFDRRKYRKFVRDDAGVIRLDEAECKIALQDLGYRYKPRCRKAFENNPQRWIFGKLIAYFSYRLVSSYLAKIDKKIKINLELFTRNLFSEYFGLIKLNELKDRNRFYSDQFCNSI